MVRRAGGLIAVALVSALTAQANRCDGPQVGCPPWWCPPKKPKHALYYNGISDIAPACFNLTEDDQRPHTVYIIGDWGGVLYGGVWAAPADHRSMQFKAHHRQFVNGVDNLAQQKVAKSMMQHADYDRVGYIINVGDNFYWGGIDGKCGQDMDAFDGGPQWTYVFEKMYHGPLDNLQWLGVLGNHDWGGWNYLSAWDQMISYTWGGPGSTNRWFQPALFYKLRAIYNRDPSAGPGVEEGFVIDYFFLDTNIYDAFDPETDPAHNICGTSHNQQLKGCPVTGPDSPGACKFWFVKIWKAQCSWLAIQLENSVLQTDWQIAVTHFPPLWGMQFWQGITKKYGVDLMITGHTHHQRLWAPWGNNPLGGTAVIISGGGGGITSEEVPDLNGWDDEYGFFKLELHRTEIIIRGVSHGAQLRKELRLYQLQPSYHIPPRDSSPALAAATPGVQDPDHDYKEEANHARIKEATKQSKIENLLDQLENARHSEMKKDDFMKIRKLSTVDPSRIYGMDMENVSEQLV